MAVKTVLFGIIGGLGLFLFGMKFLSDGLQKVAGTKLRRILRSLTQNRFRGIALGAAVTSIIQSSSVTTVMLVGLINAGIVSLTQAASVVIGANIGTTITAQIIAFKVSQYALPAIGIGAAMMIIPKRKRTQFWGQILFAFGIIFLGLSTMAGVMKPLKDIPEVATFFVHLSQSPISAIILGAIFTVAVQSSSASIGMVLALASTGLIDFQTSLFLILGDNIGTTVTAWLASIGGSTSAKRLACFHTLFNIIGTTYFYFLVQSGIYPTFIDWITPGVISDSTIARHIANSHTFFNVFNAIVFAFLIGPMVKLAEKIIPGKDIYVSSDFKYLQDKLLATPEIAIDSAKKELIAMAEMVGKTFKTSVDGFLKGDKKSIPHVQTQESAIDQLQNDITFYLAKLSAHDLTPRLASQLPPLLHSINDLERISDHAVNIAELTEKVQDNNVVFSNKAQAEMRTLYAKIEDMIEELLRSLKFKDSSANDRVLLCEGEVNNMQREFLAQHSQRLCEGKCAAISALVFVDLINNLEKIGDHITNIAKAARWGFKFQHTQDEVRNNDT